MAENVGHFAVKSIGLSRVNGRKPCTLLEAARHNLRETQAEQGATGHIDPRRSVLNRVMAGPSRAVDVLALATLLMATACVDIAKLRRDYCQAIEVVVSLPPGSTIEPDSYFAKALDWLNVALPLPVLSAVVHHDEAALHLHVLLLPLMNGKHVGSSPIERLTLKQMREGFFAQVAGPAGLQRQSAKLRGTVKQWAVCAVLKECERRGLPEKNGELWPVFLAAIECDPLRAMRALGIDLNSIRPDSDAPPLLHTGKPIGIEDSPIGIAVPGPESQSLSCVGFGSQTRSNVNRTERTNRAREVERNVSRSARLSMARAAQQSAIERQRWVKPGPAEVTSVQLDDGDWVRERDAEAHDVSAWD